MRMLLTPKVRQGLKVGLALLSIPFIAWILEFAYNHYLSPRYRRTTTPYMILSNHGHEGYDYAALNSLLRKIRRLEMQHGKNTHAFLHNTENPRLVTRLLEDLEAEQRSFTAYFYDTLDLYTKTTVPAKLRRRLQYYRSIIRQTIGKTKQLKELVGVPDNVTTQSIS